MQLASDDLKEELDEYRAQLTWAVEVGYMLPCEAEEAVDSIGCVIRLCRRGHITVGQAGHLINAMGEAQADRYMLRKRTSH